MKINLKLLLLVIALLLAGILGVLVYDMNQPKTPLEKFEAGLNDAADEMGAALQDLGRDIEDAARRSDQK